MLCIVLHVMYVLHGVCCLLLVGLGRVLRFVRSERSSPADSKCPEKSYMCVHVCTHVHTHVCAYIHAMYVQL